MLPTSARSGMSQPLQRYLPVFTGVGFQAYTFSYHALRNLYGGNSIPLHIGTYPPLTLRPLFAITACHSTCPPAQ